MTICVLCLFHASNVCYRSAGTAEGDPDVYMSCSHPPSRTDYTWRSEQWLSDILIVHNQDPQACPSGSQYYIAVRWLSVWRCSGVDIHLTCCTYVCVSKCVCVYLRVCRCTVQTVNPHHSTSWRPLTISHICLTVRNLLTRGV